MNFPPNIWSYTHHDIWPLILQHTYLILNKGILLYSHNTIYILKKIDNAFKKKLKGNWQCLNMMKLVHILQIYLTVPKCFNKFFALNLDPIRFTHCISFILFQSKANPLPFYFVTILNFERTQTKRLVEFHIFWIQLDCFCMVSFNLLL